MSKQSYHLPLRLGSQLLRLLLIVFGVASAYFMTIQSLKIELAAKAENAVVSTLDKKLSAFEVFLKEGVVSREQFFEFSRDVDRRLTRIEQCLKERTGDDLGR